METKATDIANYKGDAASALGSSENDGANVLWGATDLERANTRLDLISANNFQKNKELYAQKIKDRDEVMGKLSSGELNIDKLLPGDREQVRTKFLQPMRDMLLKNPDLKSDPDQYMAFQAAATNFDEAKKYANHRYLMITAMDNEIAAETDPRKRKRMQEHRDKSAAQGLYQEIKPYQQILDHSGDIFVSGAPGFAVRGNKAVPGPTGSDGVDKTKKTQGQEAKEGDAGRPISSVVTQDVVGDKIVTTTHTQTFNKDFIAGVLYNSVDSPNQSLRDEMKTYADEFQALPDDQKAQQVNMWNDVIRRANSDQNLKEGDPYFIPEIYAHIQKDGIVEKLVVPESAARITLAASLLKNYVNTTTKTEAVSELPGKIKKQWAELNITIPDQHKESMERIRRSQQERAKIAWEMKEAQAKAGDAQKKAAANANYYLNLATRTIDPKAYAGLTNNKDNPNGYKGSDGKLLEGIVLMGPDKGGTQHSVLADDQERAIGKVTINNKTLEVRRPDVAIISYGTPEAPHPPFIITMYKDYAAQDMELVPGSTTLKRPKPGARPHYTTEVVKGTSLVQRGIKNNQGEVSAGKDEAATYDNVMERFKEITGSDNIDKDLIELSKRQSWTGEQPPAAPAPAPTPAPPKAGTPERKAYDARQEKKRKAFGTGKASTPAAAATTPSSSSTVTKIKIEGPKAWVDSTLAARAPGGIPLARDERIDQAYKSDSKFYVDVKNSKGKVRIVEVSEKEYEKLIKK